MKEAIAAGEMVNKRSIDRLIEAQLLQFADRQGVLVDGLPRDMQQVKDFEDKVYSILCTYFRECVLCGARRACVRV